jgi:hypothetical protein
LPREKLAQLDLKISDFLALRTQLQIVVAQWGDQLDRTPEGKRAGLLESLIPPLSARTTNK